MNWVVVGTIAALLTSFGFLPQIIRIWRHRSAEDVSLLMLLQFGAGLFLWTLYGIHLGDMIIICANVISMVQVFIAIGLMLRFL